MTHKIIIDVLYKVNEKVPLGPVLRKDMKTFGFGFNEYKGSKELKWGEEFSTEEELRQRVDLFIDYLENGGMAAFDKYQDLREVDKIFNNLDNMWDSIHSKIGYSLGGYGYLNRIIIAKLSGNPNYEKIVQWSFDRIEREYKVAPRPENWIAVKRETEILVEILKDIQPLYDKYENEKPSQNKQDLNIIGSAIKNSYKSKIKYIKMPFYPQIWCKIYNTQMVKEQYNQVLIKILDDFLENLKDQTKLFMCKGQNSESVFSLRTFKPESNFFYTHFSVKANQVPYTIYPGYWDGLHVRSAVREIFLPETNDETEMMIHIRIGPASLIFLLVDVLVISTDLYKSLDAQTELDFYIYGVIHHATEISEEKLIESKMSKLSNGYSLYSAEMPNLIHGIAIVESIDTEADFLGNTIQVAKLRIATFSETENLTIPMMFNPESINAKIEQGKQIGFMASIYGYREITKILTESTIKHGLEEINNTYANQTLSSKEVELDNGNQANNLKINQKSKKTPTEKILISFLMTYANLLWRFLSIFKRKK